MEKKLYSLEAINSNKKTERHTIKVKNDLGKYENKTYLANIDKHITTYFKSKEQFLYYLKQKGIITDQYDDVKITYRHNGIQAIDLVFNDNNIIKEISKDSKTKININDNIDRFYQVLENFCELCKDDCFFKIINRSNQIPERLKIRASQLHNFIYDENELEQIQEIEEDIKNNLTNYKIFRTVVMYIDSYKNNKKFSERTMLPEKKEGQVEGQTYIKNVEVEYDRLEKEEFLSEEELEQCCYEKIEDEFKKSK